MIPCINIDEFHRKYRIVANSANGNCLFESLCFALPRIVPHYAGLKPKTLREDLARVYTQMLALKDFQTDEPIENELLNKIKIGIQYDDDDDGKKHHEKIGKDRVWASMTDVLLLGFMTHVDIYLLTLEDHQNIRVDNMTNLETPRGFVMLYYSNQEHFEAVVPNGGWRPQRTTILET